MWNEMVNANWIRARTSGSVRSIDVLAPALGRRIAPVLLHAAAADPTAAPGRLAP